MPDPITAITSALSIGSNLIKGNASEDAAQAQSDAAAQAQAENNRRYEEIVKLLDPYRQSGTQANTALGNIYGLNGDKAQQQYISNLQNSSIFKGLLQQGENSILQNASATGGLRGGNTQQALAKFSPQLLYGLLQDQAKGIGNLYQGGLSSVGTLATANQNLANNNSQLIQDQGAYRAGGILANGQSTANLLGSVGSALGSFGGGGGGGGFGFGSGGLGSIGSSFGGGFGDLSMGIF